MHRMSDDLESLLAQVLEKLRVLSERSRKQRLSPMHIGAEMAMAQLEDGADQTREMIEAGAIR